MINSDNNKHDISFEIDNILKEKWFQLLLKRIFDIVFSIIGLVILLPFFIIIAFIIKLDSVGPVIYRQIRVGKNGKEFEIYKFRTMIANIEKNKSQITIGRDSRITEIGFFLRKYKIDELPQLFNVFKGDMSFVGPRPEVPKYVKMYNQSQRDVLKVRPGITDIASIRYRDENMILGNSDNPERTYIEEIMQIKIEYNKIYIKKLSIIYDISLILETIYIVFA